MIQELLDKYENIDSIKDAMKENPQLRQQIRNEYSKVRSIVRKRIERVNEKYGEDNPIPKSLRDIPVGEDEELLEALSEVEMQREHPNAYNSITARKQEVLDYRQILENEADIHDRPYGQKLRLENEFMERNFGRLMQLFKDRYGEDIFNYMDSSRVVAWFESTKYMSRQEQARELYNLLGDPKAFEGMVTQRHPIYKRDNRTKDGFARDNEGNRIKYNYRQRERNKQFREDLKSIAGIKNGVKSKSKLKR